MAYRTLTPDELHQLERLRQLSLAHLEQLRSRQHNYYRGRQQSVTSENSVQTDGAMNLKIANRGQSQHASLKRTDPDERSDVDTGVHNPETFTKSDSVSVDKMTLHKSNLCNTDPRRVSTQQAGSKCMSDDFTSEHLPSSDVHVARTKLSSNKMASKHRSAQLPVKQNGVDSKCHTDQHTQASNFVSDRLLHSCTSPLSLSRAGTSCDQEEELSNLGYYTSNQNTTAATLPDLNCHMTDDSGTPQRLSRSVEETPKSILRHRQIIDKNVRVESKFEHTPTTGHSKRHRIGLNFSYTDVDDGELFGRKTKSVNFRIADQTEQGSSKVASDGQADRKLSDKTVSDSKSAKKKSPGKSSHRTSSALKTKSHFLASDSSDQLPSSQRFYYISQNDTVKSDGVSTADCVEESLKTTYANSHPMQISEENNDTRCLTSSLLLHTGNDRKNANIVRELQNRSRSSVFSSDHDSNDQGLNNLQPNNSSLSKSYLEDGCNQQFSRLLSSRQSGPLLGYDWIAGTLDNKQSIDTIPDEYFDEVREFRRLNRDACVGSVDFLKSYEIGRPITPEIQNPTHTCIHGYTVNDRLFTEPVNVDENGKSICPLCHATRRDPAPESPGFVRVSIPQSTLDSPYKVKPHRRRSFNATDSCALAQHCLAGWECSNASNIPTASSLDLRHASNGLRSKMTTTDEQVRKIADGFSKTTRLVQDYARV